jgi:hypothetical protein
VIDNNHLIYAGVIMVFLAGATIVAMAAMLTLAAGFAVVLAVRFQKRRKRLTAVAAESADGVFAQVTWETFVSHLSQDQDDQGSESRRAADLPLVINSVCKENCPVRVTIVGLRR